MQGADLGCGMELNKTHRVGLLDPFLVDDSDISMADAGKLSLELHVDVRAY